MKKMMITVTALGALLCTALTGCSVNVNDDTISAAANVAASMLDDANISINGQPVDISVDSNGDVNVNIAQTTAPDKHPAVADMDSNPSPDVSGIVGTWYEAEALDARTLTIAADGSFQLAYRGGGSKFGKVNWERTLNADGEAQDFYMFYDQDGDFLGSFRKTDDPQNDLFSHFAGPDGRQLHFFRAPEEKPVAEDETDIRNLVGDWYYQAPDPQNSAVFYDEAYITINEDGTYIYQPTNGEVRCKGTIKLEYEEYADGSKVPHFAFYDVDGNFWNGIYCGHFENGAYYFGNGGVTRIIRRNPDANPYEEYVGTWQSDRCSIRISDLGYVEIHWANSAFEDCVWEYGCVYSPDGTRMECPGGGKKTIVTVAADGTEKREVVYNDGTATFRKRGDILFWSDGMEDVAMEMGFTKIG